VTERAKLYLATTTVAKKDINIMCRISGIINKNQYKDTLVQQVQLMSDSMNHGGPDDSGLFIDNEHHVCLGNKRLSILDMSSNGHQPMQSIKGDVVVTFNGEIYNFKALREQLISEGYLFRSKTDTEVIIYAYKHWGEKAFEKFNGMFAFCLFDKNSQLVYLVRDPTGIKPLYYKKEQNSITFASEVKAFKYAGINQINEDWQIYFLAFGHIPEPYTTLKDVESLPKGCFLKYNLSNADCKISSYFNFKHISYITHEDQAIELVKKELNDAIERQLVSDTEIGVLFSGGLDSSIIALLANHPVNAKLSCISANFDEIDYSEHRQRSSLSGRLNIKKIEQLITYSDFVHNFDSILSDMDQPSNDGINTWFVCKTAKAYGIKSVLSGLGADELFGGYPSFERIHTIQNLSWLSRSTLKSARFLKETKLKRLYYLSLDSPIGEYLCLRGVYSPDLIAKLLDINMKTVVECLENIPINPLIKSFSNETRASWFEFNIYMQNQLLKDTDFMSMSHGVEVRVPFLDRNFINLVNSISKEIKFSYDQKKKLLVDAYKNELPQEIWNRSKMGFTFPFQEWMRKNREISDPDRYHNNTAKALMQTFKQNNLHWSSAFSLYRLFHAS